MVSVQDAVQPSERTDRQTDRLRAQSGVEWGLLQSLTLVPLWTFPSPLPRRHLVPGVAGEMKSLIIEKNNMGLEEDPELLVKGGSPTGVTSRYVFLRSGEFSKHRSLSHKSMWNELNVSPLLLVL